MKLQSLLQEDTFTDLNLSEFIQGLDAKYETKIRNLLNKFKSYNKIQTNDSNEDNFFFHITNNLVEFDFIFSKEEGNLNSGEPYISVQIAAMVNDKIVFNSHKIEEHNYHLIALDNTFSRKFQMANEHKCFEFADHILKVASDFEEWYFDIVSSAGSKVKLIKISIDLESGYSNSTWKWTPYLGQFFVEKDEITVRTA